MTMRWLFPAVLVSLSAFAQTDPTTQPKVIVVPVPAEAADAGVASSEPQPTTTTVPVPQEPQPQPVYVPPPEQPVYQPPPAEPVRQADPPPPQEPIDPSLLPPDKAQPAGAMLDGHPREGAFLAGPGSLAFIVHHTLWGASGALATQLASRFQTLLVLGPEYRSDGVFVGDAELPGLDPRLGCADPNALADYCSAADADDRAAYLTSGLVGAGLGFVSSAIWQFTHWLDRPAVTAGFLHGLYAGLFFAGFSGFFTGDATAIAWASFLGSEAAMWSSIILGGGELPTNKVLFISSGAFWATVFVGFLMGIVNTSGSAADARMTLNALMIAPGIGALATGLFSIKYSPSIAKVLRADLFGVLAGAAVYVVSALVLGAKFLSPVPYVLAPIASAGAITVVSLLWADSVESPTVAADGAAKARDPLWWW